MFQLCNVTARQEAALEAPNSLFPKHFHDCAFLHALKEGIKLEVRASMSQDYSEWNGVKDISNPVLS